ncbi:MAG TPA: hypothetical protein VMU28_15240 [Terriglobales bacterium]|nr:hypothetical protein [Terriglobales bacterium]
MIGPADTIYTLPMPCNWLPLSSGVATGLMAMFFYLRITNYAMLRLPKVSPTTNTIFPAAFSPVPRRFRW